MGKFGVPELILILIIFLLLFGADRLPKIARSIGESIKEFKKALKEKEDNQDTKKDKQ